jgi:membrane-associated protease RseP (regulator of RpoE activity)
MEVKRTMSKKVIYMLALAVLVLATAGLGVWAGLATDKAKADDSSQTQTSKPWMGVSLADITPKLVQQLGLTQDKGVVIVKVVTGSPAEQAGLQAKDILLKIGDTAIDTAKTAVSTISSYKVGDTVTLTILRGTQQQTVNVTLAAAPSASVSPETVVPLQGYPGFGLSGLNLPNLLKDLNLEGIEQGQLFDHYLGTQIQLTDKDGNAVTVKTIPGTVASVSDNTIVLNNNGGGTVTLTVPDDAIIRKGTGTVALSALAAGDKVVVVTINDQVKAVLGGQEVTIWPGMRGGNGLGGGLMPELFGQRLRSGIGNMLNNMMKNWQGNLERFQNKLQENKSLKTGVMWE